jgi:hypothetical protein
MLSSGTRTEPKNEADDKNIKQSTPLAHIETPAKQVLTPKHSTLLASASGKHENPNETDGAKKTAAVQFCQVRLLQQPTFLLT